MALRKIVEVGADCLTKVCRPVTDFNGRLHQLLDDLRETLEKAEGAGLAAPQVGILRRVCVVLDESGKDYLELVNPEILEQSGEQTGLEGCLSIPGQWGIVTRPQWVKIQAQDRHGKKFEREASGLTARAFCHEIEHLDGHMYSEHIDHFLSEEEVQEFLDKEEKEERERKEREEREKNGEIPESKQIQNEPTVEHIEETASSSKSENNAKNKNTLKNADKAPVKVKKFTKASKKKKRKRG